MFKYLLLQFAAQYPNSYRKILAVDILRLNIPTGTKPLFNP